MTDLLPWPESLWAAVTPAGETYQPAKGTLTADCVVIGAGFTGLSTALHLAKAKVDTIVLEAAQPGFGASGRNNGQVIPTLTRPDPDDIERRHGEAGERFVSLIRDCARDLFELARAERLDDECEQTGWMQPVHTPGRMKIAERRVSQWSKRGAPVELLSRDQVRAMSGSDAWHGGFWNTTGGHINPLAFTRGLAAAAARHGAHIYGATPARAYTHENGRWRVTTPDATITARSLVLASNAYTGEFARALAPDIAKEVVPVLSWQLATAPLGDNVRRTILPGRQALSDTHGDLYFMRYDARHRLITGGALIVPTRGADRLRERIGERLTRLYPQLGEIAFDYVWNGYIGMTTDFMPRFHRIGPDGYAWVGCNGRGVGLSVAIGRELAKAVRGMPDHDLALPFSEPRPLPAHGLLRRLAPLRLMQFRYNDAREI
jgi:glycine/D-amino acid oxidase-like deaminating enzyme